MWCSTSTTAVLSVNARIRVGQLVGLRRRQPARGLVEQQQFRLGHQRAGQRDAFARAVGKRAGQEVADVGDVELASSVQGSAAQFGLVARGPAGTEQGGDRAGPGESARAGHHVLEHGEPAEQAEPLQGAGDAEPGELVGPVTAQRLALPAQLARLRPDEPADRR